MLTSLHGQVECAKRILLGHVASDDDMAIKMSTLLSAFKTLVFQAPDKEPSDSARLLVAKYSRGNVSLQLGRYTTEQQIAERRNNLCDYKFSV